MAGLSHDGISEFGCRNPASRGAAAERCCMTVAQLRPARLWKILSFTSTNRAGQKIQRHYSRI